MKPNSTAVSSWIAFLPALVVALPLIAAEPAKPVAPAPASWSADPAGSTLEFVFTQADAKTTGHFTKFSANVDFMPADLAKSKIDVTVDLASVDTRDKDRNATLKEADWFDVGKLATARWVATQFSAKGSGYEGRGKLTLKLATRDVPISFTWRTATEAGKTVAWLQGTASLKRTDFGIGGADAESLQWIANDVAVSFNLRLLPRVN